ncbi:MAG TPA: MarR family transcriptional regulator [Pseudonocardiaceae bacterium]|jgi:DNA-binding MarR family transcriptional regulator
MTVTEPDLRTQAQEIVAHIRVLRRDLLCASAEDVARSGLTGPQVSVMAHLVMNGPATVTELGRELGTGHSTVSGIVDRLQARGLVQRVQDDTDRRYTRICVTEKVDRYVADMEAGPFGRLAIALGNATGEQRRTIRDGLSLLRELLT